MAENEANAAPAADAAAISGHLSGPAAGPLVVSEANPRYFTVASGDADNRRAVYLTGSHIWNNFHDGGPGSDCAETPEQLDYDAYLAFLKEHGHNFIRLWRWEQFKSQAAGGNFHLCMTPQPWPRTGPGTAKDGKPKFDLSAFDQAYFDRLRDRVIAAGNEGIYVAVMLFDGFGPSTSARRPTTSRAIRSTPPTTSTGSASPRSTITRCCRSTRASRPLQEAYIRKVVDTVHDLPNVLYEVANESSGGGSVDDRTSPRRWGWPTRPTGATPPQWQYWVIDLVKQLRAADGVRQAPRRDDDAVPRRGSEQGQRPTVRQPRGLDLARLRRRDLRRRSAPDGTGQSARAGSTTRPPSDGTKVVITDTDHYAPGQGRRAVGLEVVPARPPPDPDGLRDHRRREPARPFVGHRPVLRSRSSRLATRWATRFATREQMDLVAMEPRGDLSSTGYALANPGEEYLVLQPSETAEPFTVTLEAGTYSVEWHSVTSRETKAAGKLTVESPGGTTFAAPFAEAGPAVLYLKAVEG